MKRALTYILMGLMPFSVFSQICVPNAPSGTPGLEPVTDSLDCIERGMTYQETIFIENFDSFFVSAFGWAYLNFLRIDSITNIPCGITWQSNKPGNTYDMGETGCIQVFGTTNDSVGQYRLGLYITVQIDIGITVLEYQDEAADLVATIENLTGLSLGINFKYFVRVIEPGMTCPAVDTSSSFNNLIASYSCGFTPLGVNIAGNDTACEGDLTQLVAMVTGGTPPYSYAWSPVNSLDNILDSAATATSLVTTTYSVTVTDANNATAVDMLEVNVLPLPQASFNFAPPVGQSVAFTNFSSFADQVEYFFGDGGSNTNPNVVHSYAIPGVYEVKLVATNECGADTMTRIVDLTTGILSNAAINDLVKVYPNPNTGTFEISLLLKDSNVPYKLNVFDLNGKKIYSETLAPASRISSYAIDLSGAQSGIYTLQLVSDQGLANKKIFLY